MNIDRAEFAAALTRAASATGKILPITQHVRLETVDGFLTVTGTNLDVTIEVIVPAAGAELAPVLVPAAIAKQAGALSSDRVDFTVKNHRATLEGDATFRMPTFPVDDWPTLTPPTEAGWVPADGFRERFTAAQTHSGTDAGRPHFMCVALADGMIAATDSYRMALIDEEGVPTDRMMLVPPVKLSAPVDRIDFDQRHIMFTTPEGRMWARLHETAGFPAPTKLRGMTPGKGSVGVSVDSTALAHAAHRASMVAFDGKGVRLEQTDTGLRLSVAGESEFEETVPATFTDPMPPFTVRPEFLRDGLAPVPGMVDLTVPEKARAPIMVSKGWWKSIIMPVTLSS